LGEYRSRHDLRARWDRGGNQLGVIAHRSQHATRRKQQAKVKQEGAGKMSSMPFLLIFHTSEP
jgi:hypothetical protein